MFLFGFELVAQRTWSILPNDTFSMAILWNMKKIPSSIGKDFYHESGLILPDKRIAATGRIHHMSEETINRFEPLQTAPCQFINYPQTSLVDLRIELSLTNAESIETIDRTTILYFWKKEKDSAKMTRTVIYLDPQSIGIIHSNQFSIDISFSFRK